MPRAARRLRIATRGSELARWQANHVADRLIAAHRGLEVTLVVVDTPGDRRQGDLAVEQLGGQGVFVKEVQAAVLDGRADVAVHSAKDLPSVTAPGLRAGVRAGPGRPPRRPRRHRRLDELPPGARVGHRVGAAPGPARRICGPT